MGSWNATCGLSQLPIKSGTKVKAVIIQNKPEMPEASGFCYQEGYASPITFIIDAEYNDYGSLENIVDNKAMKLFRQYFNQKLNNEEITVDSDDYYDREMFPDGDIDYTKITNEQLIDLFERDRVNIETSYYHKDGMKKTKVNLGIMMIHNDVYESARESIFNSTEWGYEDFTVDNLKKDCLYAVEDMFETIKLSKYDQIEVDELKEKLKVLDKDSEEFAEVALELIDLIKLSSVTSKSWDSEVRKYSKWSNKVSILRGSEGSNMRAFNIYHGLLKAEFRIEEKEEIIEMLYEMVCLLNMMSILRKPWIAQPGKGSQSFDEDVYIGFAKGILNAIYNDREDLTGCEVYCMKNLFEFKKDNEYKCIYMNHVYDKICIEIDNDTKRVITYSEFKEHFEY